MKCILASEFGKPDKVLAEGEKPAPVVTPGSGHLLLRVQACGLTPGDYRLLLGDCDCIKKPFNGFPYIPGLDVSGTVTAVDEGNEKCAGFKVGDEVVASWGGVQGEGGMAEFALVDAKCAALRPASVSPVMGAALANSASHAVAAVRAAAVKPGDRVLVLGGSGGVGHLAVQFARKEGAAYVAATSTDAAMLAALGVDRVIDYRSEEWADVPEFSESKFDVIIDCAVGKEAWFHPKRSSVLKSGRDGGRFVAVVHNEWHIEMHSLIGLPLLLLPPFGRVIRSRILPGTPKYIMYLGGVDTDSLQEVLKLADEGHLKAAIHEGKTFAFTEQGAKDAFNLMISRRGHGKVVMDMSQNE